MSNKTPIYYEVSGQGRQTLVFVHGWLGNCRWWDAQRDFFQATYRVITLDLGGHGRSKNVRQEHSVDAYAEDISSVIQAADASNVILIGHSMSGANVVQAFAKCRSRVVGMILVDTLQNLDAMMNYEQAKPFLDMVKSDYRSVVLNQLSQHLFRPESPSAVVQRLQAEFLSVPAEQALASIEPFYRTDIRPAASQVNVPVRGINTTIPTAAEANRHYFADFDFSEIPGSGHYPMLEQSPEFNAVLDRTLRSMRSLDR